jgi:hypothetical protein
VCRTSSGASGRVSGTRGAASPEPLLHQEHELLLALVGDLHVVDELRELRVAVVRQEKSLARLAEELDEVAVVARADVRQARVRRVDVGRDGGVQQLLQRRPVVAQRLEAAPLALVVVAAARRRVVVVVAAAQQPAQVGARARRDAARRRHRAPPQNVRQHRGAQHVLHHQRHHARQLRLAQRVAQRARPVDVVDGGMRILGEKSVLKSSRTITLDRNMIWLIRVLETETNICEDGIHFLFYH